MRCEVEKQLNLIALGKVRPPHASCGDGEWSQLTFELCTAPLLWETLLVTCYCLHIVDACVC